MKRCIALMVPVLLLAGCEEEVISRRESSVASQFALLARGGGSIDSANQQVAQQQQPKNNSGVNVIKPADFSGYKFDTSFQRDDQVNRNQPNSQDGQGPPTIGSGIPGIPGR